MALAGRRILVRVAEFTDLANLCVLGSPLPNWSSNQPHEHRKGESECRNRVLPGNECHRNGSPRHKASPRVHERDGSTV